MCNVMEAVGLRWVLAGGAILEVLGLILLVTGLDDTRQDFDSDYPGIWTTLWAWLRRTGAWATSTGRQLLRMPKDATVYLEAIGSTVSVGDGTRVRLKRGAPSDQLPLDEQIAVLHELMYEEVFRLEDRIEAESEERIGAVGDERTMWQAGDSAIRSDVSNLSISGLGTEAWAVVLIVFGMLVTYAAAICSLG
jgi:hypothetical protein